MITSCIVLHIIAEVSPLQVMHEAIRRPTRMERGKLESGVGSEWPEEVA